MQETEETQVPSLGWEDLLEQGTATHPSILAWRLPWTGWGTVHRVTEWNRSEWFRTHAQATNNSDIGILTKTEFTHNW